MIPKQDKAGARTPADLERKYNFGESFAEVMGIATDARRMAEEAKVSADSASSNLTHEAIFNLLTENGKHKGIYDENGELYINASYLKSGIIDAAVVKVVNLIAERLTSQSSLSRLDINSSEISLKSKAYGETIRIINYINGVPYIYLTQYDPPGIESGRGLLGANQLYLGTRPGDPDSVFSIDADPKNYETYITINGEQKSISWRDNGDGTYSLIGT